MTNDYVEALLLQRQEASDKRDAAACAVAHALTEGLNVHNGDVQVGLTCYREQVEEIGSLSRRINGLGGEPFASAERCPIHKLRDCPCPAGGGRP